MNGLISLGGSWDVGKKVYTAPYSVLASGTEYKVEMTGFKDAAGNPGPAFTYENSPYAFTTTAGGDTTPPTIVSITPADSATGVAVNGNIVITFDEEMYTAGTVYLAAGVNSLYPTGGSWSAGNTVYTVAYSGLAHETEYYVYTYENFYDAAGNIYEDSGNGLSIFTTIVDPLATYSVSLDKTTFDFGAVAAGYTQPAFQSAKITNTGTGTLTISTSLSTPSNYEDGSIIPVDTLDAGETLNISTRPKAGLAAGTYNETLTITATKLADGTLVDTKTIALTFKVE